MIHESMKNFFVGFPPTAHPMMVLSAMLASLSAYYPTGGDEEDIDLNIVRLLAKAPTIAALSYKHGIGQPFVYPRNDLSYTENFLHMMFAVPAEPYEVTPVLDKALNLLLMLHADHEQNCSTSTVRLVGSSHVQPVRVDLGRDRRRSGGRCTAAPTRRSSRCWRRSARTAATSRSTSTKAKDKRRPLPPDGLRPPGLQELRPAGADPQEGRPTRCSTELGIDDPLLEIARNLEKVALEDEYFVERKLYPNVDFYSGILYRAMGIPTEMFTVMFALGRLPGWIAQWKEMREGPGQKIGRPRQIYQGETERPFVPLDKRGGSAVADAPKPEPVSVV